VADEFANDVVGPLVPGWNTYSPLWGGVSIVAGSDGNHLQLENRDPYDYARADRVFGEASQVTAQFKVMVDAPGAGQLQIELWSPTGDVRPVRIVLTPDGVIGTMNSGAEAAEIGRFKAGQWVTMKIEADTKSRKYSVMIEGKPAATDLDFAENANALARLVFRTGNYRRPAPISAQTRWIDPATDKPTAPARFRVGDVHID
jgi:hypothetical protein